MADYQVTEDHVTKNRPQDSVSVQLERMLARPPLISSPSLSRLLRFVVEESLAGRGADLNEYNLGVRIFNRAADFNPRTDPIVRVQAHHLRARLAQYYAAAGAQDPVLIELPSRTYVPRYPEPVPIAAPVVAEPGAQALVPAPVATETTAQNAPRTTRRTWAIGSGMLVVAFASFALLGGWRQGNSKQVTPDATAQDLYSHGRLLLDRQSEDSLRESVDCFRQAILRDPKFAAAHAGLADALDVLVQFGYMSPRDGMEEARREARQSLALDPHLAEGYVASAAISEAYDWNFKKAETEYRRALELNPELAAAHLWYGMFLRDQSRLDEALPELRRAEQLSPTSELATINLAYALRMAGESEAAFQMAQRTQELDPDAPIADLVLANIYRSRKDDGGMDAKLAHAEALAAENPHLLSALACSYARIGRRDDSVRLLNQMQALAKERYVSPFDLGNVALSLGDEERAATWLEAAFRERSTGMVFLVKEESKMMTSPRLRSLVERIRQS